jgi:hypothetical protein
MRGLALHSFSLANNSRTRGRTRASSLELLHPEISELDTLQLRPQNFGEMILGIQLGGDLMSAAASTTLSAYKPIALAPILWGGLTAGALDLTAAFVTWGVKGVSPIRIAQSIASGLLGRAAYEGRLGTAALGIALHFFIAFSATIVFYAASRKLAFLTQHPVRWGFLYGITVYMVMYWIVIPLSAIPKSQRPPSLSGTVIAILTHMFCVGLPISLGVWRYSR